jgi:hypothetical protein
MKRASVVSMLVLLVFLSAEVRADYMDFNGTLVNKDLSPGSTEQTLLTVYNTVYGVSYDWGDLVPLQVLNDEVWRVSRGTVQVKALYSRLGQVFGLYTDPGVGVAKQPLVGLPDGTPDFLNDPSAPSASYSFSGATQVGFYRGGTDTGWYSEPGLNPGVDQGQDHLVAFSSPNYRSYLLFWEDRTFELTAQGVMRSDLDFNDFVVQLTPVPEPASMLLVLGGLSGVAWFRRKRHPHAA